MQGIDVSSHNGYPFNGATENAYQSSDFVIAKATQGVSYVNPGCDYAIQRAINDGKLFGFYHYASGNSPEDEAHFFYDNSKNYFGHGIPIIDWESYQNDYWGDPSWVRRFVDRIHELTGVWCMIYVQASAIDQVSNCADDCALWVAGYPVGADSWDVPDFYYNIAPWDAYTLWQFTSGGGVDRNIANVSPEGWLKIAAGEGVPDEAPETSSEDEEQDQEQPYYSARTVNGIWLDMMRGLTDTGGSGDDFAGVYGSAIGYISIGGVGAYRVRSKDSGWLPYVDCYNPDDLANGSAGDGSAITGIEIPNDGIRYQAHTVGGDWLPWMTGNVDTGGSSDDFAGNGSPIDAVRIELA